MTIIVAILLFVGAAIELICVAGVVAMENVFEKLHFVAPAAAFGTLAFAIAIILEEGASQLAVKAALVWAILLLSGPVLAHATARAARIRQFDGWLVTEGEKGDAHP